MSIGTLSKTDSQHATQLTIKQTDARIQWQKITLIKYERLLFLLRKLDLLKNKSTSGHLNELAFGREGYKGYKINTKLISIIHRHDQQLNLEKIAQKNILEPKGKPEQKSDRKIVKAPYFEYHTPSLKKQLINATYTLATPTVFKPLDKNKQFKTKQKNKKKEQAIMSEEYSKDENT